MNPLEIIPLPLTVLAAVIGMGIGTWMLVRGTDSE